MGLPEYACAAFAGYMPGENLFKTTYSRLLSEIRSTVSAYTILSTINLPHRAQVLEVGIGVGDLTNKLSIMRTDLKVVGLDGSLGVLQLNKKRKYLPTNANIAHLPFANDSYDCIYSTDVYEHENDASFAVSELYRVLKPGGWMIHAIADPAEARYWNVRDHKHRPIKDESTHVNFWEEIFLQAGFELSTQINESLRRKDWRKIIRENPIPVIRNLSERPGFASVINKFHRPGVYVCHKPA